jgi:hypothetical protein
MYCQEDYSSEVLNEMYNHFSPFSFRDINYLLVQKLWTKYKTSAIRYSFTEATSRAVTDVMRKIVTLSM